MENLAFNLFGEIKSVGEMQKLEKKFYAANSCFPEMRIFFLKHYKCETAVVNALRRGKRLLHLFDQCLQGEGLLHVVCGADFSAEFINVWVSRNHYDRDIFRACI